MAIVDAQYVRHLKAPTLGNQGEARGGRPAWEGVDTRRRGEWGIFNQRMEKTEKRTKASI